MFFTVIVTLNGLSRTWSGLNEAAAKRIMHDVGFKPGAHVIVKRED